MCISLWHSASNYITEAGSAFNKSLSFLTAFLFRYVYIDHCPYAQIGHDCTR